MGARRRWPLAVALGMLALPGCADILGIGDPIISDGGAIDGHTDAKADAAKDAPTDVAKDAPTDADGGGCGSGLACEQCNVSGYTPWVQSKPTTKLNACTPTQIADFVTACIGVAATQTTCQNWQIANADGGSSSCVSCVLTMQSAAAWGPVVCTSTGCTFNNPGCLDLELGQVNTEKQAGGNGSCGDVLSDSYGCQDYACGTCGQGNILSADFQTCANSATVNECKSYTSAFNNASQCAVLNGDAAPPGALKCFPQGDTEWQTFVNVFCGTGP